MAHVEWRLFQQQTLINALYASLLSSLRGDHISMNFLALHCYSRHWDEKVWEESSYIHSATNGVCPDFNGHRSPKANQHTFPLWDSSLFCRQVDGEWCSAHRNIPRTIQLLPCHMYEVFWLQPCIVEFGLWPNECTQLCKSFPSHKCYSWR